MYTCIWSPTGEALIQRSTDGAAIPRNNLNSDYVAFKAWLIGQALTWEQWLAENPYIAPIVTVDDQRKARYVQECDPLKPEAEAELRQGRPTKYFEYMAKRFQIRRETEPEETKLDLVKKDQVSYWKTVCDMMIESKYPTTNMLAYKDLKDQAYAEGKLHRFAYLNQISTWGMALFQEFYTVEAYINAAPSVEFAIAQAIDLKAWEAADPKVTFAGALAIAD